MIRKIAGGFEVAVDMGRDPSGKRLRIWRRAKTKAAAVSLEAGMIAQRDTGTTIQSGKITTGEFLNRWLRDHCEPNLAPKTVLNYGQLIRTHILPHVGSIPLTRLRPLHIQAVYARIQASGRSRLAHHVHRVLKTALRAAMKWQLIVQNPCDAVEAPRFPASEMDLPDHAGITRLLAAADATRHGPMIRLTLETGLRLGEISGLRWIDLNLDDGTLRVSQSVQWLPGRGCRIQPPKTARSRRVVALSQAAVQALRQHRVKQQEHRLRLGPVYKDDDLVFPSEIGTPLIPQNFNRAWKRITAEAGVTLKFHGLRHLSATLALAEGVNVRVVSDRLGHANASVTLNVYAHVMAGADAEAAESIAAALRRTG